MFKMGIDYPVIVKKVWGHEEIIVDNGEYCGKRLCLNEGYRCSIHRHEKLETFYIESGQVYLELEETPGSDEMKNNLLTSGNVVDIPRNSWHRFSGLEDSVIVEFSTPDTDSERKTRSEKIEYFENFKNEV